MMRDAAGVHDRPRPPLPARCGVFAVTSVALVHDYLSQCGGAERVVLELAAMFPEAPIYTSFFAPEATFAEFAGKDVRTSSLQSRIDPDRFRSAVLRYPRAFRTFDLSAFDTVVVSSSAFAHHVVHRRSFVYWHTPPRFLYQPASYGLARPLRAAALPLLAALRRADATAAARHLSYAANSEATASRVRSAYGRSAVVIHPPLRTGHLPVDLPPLPATPRALVVSRLLPYKRIDVAVQACRLAGMPLTVVGEGPQERTLRHLGAGTVDFLGRLGETELPAVFAAHSVVLVPGQEDFGYVPVEANYAGRPVVAFAAGGALETVVDGVTGQLVPTHDPAEWAAALRSVHDRAWSPASLREATTRFGADAFQASVRQWLEST